LDVDEHATSIGSYKYKFVLGVGKKDGRGVA